MRIPVAPLLLTFGLAMPSLAAAQTLTAESDTVKQLAKQGFLEVKYDRIEGVTVIKGDEWTIGGTWSLTGPILSLRLACAVPGRELAGSTPTCVAAFSATSGRGFDLGPDANVTLLADDSVRVRLGRQARGDVDWSSGLFSESFVFPIAPADILRLEGSEEILGRIADREFKLGGESRRTIDGLASIFRLIGAINVPQAMAETAP